MITIVGRRESEVTVLVKGKNKDMVKVSDTFAIIIIRENMHIYLKVFLKRLQPGNIKVLYKKPKKAIV